MKEIRKVVQSYRVNKNLRPAAAYEPVQKHKYRGDLIMKWFISCDVISDVDRAIITEGWISFFI